MNKNRKRLGLNKKLLTSAACVSLLLSSGQAMAVPTAEAPVFGAGEEQQAKTIDALITVTDATGPVVGASVIQKGTTNGNVTDLDGTVKLNVPEGAVIQVSFVGYKTQEIAVTSAVLNVVLQQDAAMLDDVVVVGYGVQKKVNLTGAVSNVDVDKAVASRPITDVAKALQGVTPGLSITNKIGGVGTESTIKLRGSVGSLSASGGTAPLILVDNVEVPSLNLVNPDDIATISVLKDAASSSIYGTRAAWGVILITTKQGKKDDRVTVSYSNNFAWSTPTVMPTIASASDNAEFMMAVAERLGKNSISNIGYNIDASTIEKLREWEQTYGGMSNAQLGEMQEGRDFEIIGGKTYFYRSFDALGMFTKKWTPQQQHNVSVTGGSEKTTFNIGMGYLNQKGIMKFNTDSYDRFTLNSNITTEIRDWWKVRTNVLFTRSSHEQPYRYTSGQYDAWNYLMRWPRWYPYTTYQGKEFRSAVTDIKAGNRETLNENYLRANIGTEISPIKDLTINFDYTFSLLNYEQKRNGGTVMAYDMFSSNPFGSYKDIYGPSHDRVVQTSQYTMSNIFKAYATYNKSFNDKHNLKVMVGMDAEARERLGHYSERRGLISPTLPEIILATGEQYSANGSYSYHNDFAAVGFFARVNYDYMGKYLLEVNARYDGSSKFPEGDKFALFPSFSAGWRMSEEKFMQSLKPYFSSMKLRASWGTIGNQDVAANSFISTMTASPESGWVVDNEEQVYVGAPSVISPSLTWERVTTLDLGLDARFFNDELGVSFDWYKRVTSDMHCMGETLPDTFGAAVPKINYGELTGKGWELALDYNKRFECGLGLTLTASVSHVKEEITKYNNSVNNIYGNYQGKRIGEIWGYETDRLFTFDDFDVTKDEFGNKVYTLKDGIPSQALYEKGAFRFGPGDVKYRDLNGDGVINYGKKTLEDHGDLKVIGNTLPDYEYSFSIGFNYKGFDFSTLFQGVGKRDFWGYGSVAIPAGGSGYGDAAFTHQMDYWTPEHQNAFYPRPDDNGWNSDGKNFLTQTRFLSDMSYLRCKNITVGYTLPEKWMKKIHFQSARIYLSAENVFEFDNMHLPIDPESTAFKEGHGDSSWSFGRSYPYSRTISVGLQLQF